MTLPAKLELGERPIVVLGMHRSGTSALTGTLSHFGVALGANLLVANEDVNARGFFELSDVVEVHDELLDALGSSWSNPSPLPEKWWRMDAVAEHRDRLIHVLEKSFANEAVWAVKDPRLCRLLPLWLDLFAAADALPSFVIVYRHPLEVVASLKQRDGVNDEHAMVLWVEHMLAAEHATRAFPRTFVSYHALLSDWRSVVDQIASDLDLTWPSEPASAVVDDFLDTGLCHQVVGENVQVPPSRHPWPEQIFQILESANTVSNAKLPARMDEVSAQFDLARGLFAPAIGDAVEKVAELSDGLVAAKGIIDSKLPEYSDALKSMHSTVQARDAEIERLKQELSEARAQHQLLALDDAVDWAVDESLEAQAGGEAGKAYDGRIDFNVDNNSHTKIFRYLERDANARGASVLEVGCHTGYFGLELKNRGFEVWGLELNGDAACVARERLDRVFVGSIERYLQTPAFRNLRFDYIVFGDVLEHLSDPVQVLSQCRGMLNENGAVLASIPNVAHAAVRLMLLEGRWEYAEHGILDDTHLRFFTASSIVELFDRAGFTVEDIEPVRVGIEHTGIPVNSELLDFAAPHLRDDAADVFQYAVLARAPEVLPTLKQEAFPHRSRLPLRLLALPPIREWTIGDLRLKHPLSKYCMMYGGELRLKAWPEHDADDLDWADVVFLQRESNAVVLDLIDRVQRAGKFVVMDMDDLLTEMPDFLSAATASRERREHLLSALGKVDVVTVTTERLGDALAEHCARVHVVPNCTFAAHPPVTHRARERVRLIVASSDTVRIDFVLSAIRRLQDAPDLDVELIGIGPPGEHLAARGFKLAQRVGLMSHGEFKAYISSLDNAVGLIPLDSSPFSACKSSIKFIDYSLAGIPSVCSDVPPYSDTVEHDVTGVLCANEESAWVNAVRELAKSADKRNEMAQAARRAALREHGVSRAAQAWNSLLEDSVVPDRKTTVSEESRAAKYRTLASMVVRPSVYRTAMAVLKAEGARGVARRISRYF